MREAQLISQYSALLSMVFMMAFVITFDGIIWRNRWRDRRRSRLLREYCTQAAA